MRAKLSIAKSAKAPTTAATITPVDTPFLLDGSSGADDIVGKDVSMEVELEVALVEEAEVDVVVMIGA
jgi:hypothetical protein